MTKRLLSLGLGAFLFGASVLTMAVTADPAPRAKAACTHCEMCKGGTCTCEDCAGCCAGHCPNRS